MRRAILLLVVAACSKTEVDPNATAIEIATTIDAADGITQLRLSGTTTAGPAFAPGVVPDSPRPLSGEQTAVVLLPEALGGEDVLVRVDALAGDALVHTGGGTVAVQAREMKRLDVTLGDPAVCGDGKVAAPFEACDDGNAATGDGCSTNCSVETGWTCVGIMPSMCNPVSTHKEIVTFGFLAVANIGLKNDVIATINGSTISATVPFGTNVSALVATFAMTGAGARVNGVPQTSGSTPNDFSSPVTYTVVGEDNSVRTYTVIITVATNSSKDLTSFKFLAACNQTLNADITATINGTAIAATVPTGTDVTGLVATFETTGASVMVGATPQTSCMTANNFSSPLVYTVTAGDASTKQYMVSVTVAASSAKAITSFMFRSVDNSTLGMDVVGTINGTAISATVPSTADVTGLVATFGTTGTSVSIGATAQTSGQTANDFTNPVVYTVTAADMSTQMYTVTITVAAGSAKDISFYGFRAVDNPGVLSVDVAATINGTAITAIVPSGTNVTGLVAEFTTTGSTVTVNGATQTSRITPNNFTSTVTYVVTAADMSTKTYTVTVTIAAGSAKDITSFQFLSSVNPMMGRDVICTINGTAIACTLPNGASQANLIATFATTGTTVKVGTVVQTSGVTANSFASPVMYVVTAADLSTKTYTVTVTVASTSDKDITAFAFLSAKNPGLSADAIGTINGPNITVTLPPGSTGKTALIATFSTTGKNVKIGTKAQISGQTIDDFTNPVVYTVTAQDNSTKMYTVTVN